MNETRFIDDVVTNIFLRAKSAVAHAVRIWCLGGNEPALESILEVLGASDAAARGGVGIGAGLTQTCGEEKGDYADERHF